MERIIRIGVYGVLLEDSKILLTLKRSGPYQGLWDLPGGGIEFGETPEATLGRELFEEVGAVAERLKFLYHATAVGEYKKQNVPYGFHQVGLIYHVLNWRIAPEASPQEESRWVALKGVFQELTPFTKGAISHFIDFHK